MPNPNRQIRRSLLICCCVVIAGVAFCTGLTVGNYPLAVMAMEPASSAVADRPGVLPGTCARAGSTGLLNRCRAAARSYIKHGSP